MSRHPFAALIGKSYAHFQHGLDQLIEWGVTKLKNAEPEETKRGGKQKQGSRMTRVASKAIRGTLGFVGTLAGSYFDKYRELKTNERDSSGKTSI